MHPRRLLLAALALLLPVAAHAATPANTLVVAKQIDDIITLDPAEAYELSDEEVITNVYDRLIRYEAEDLTKMVGGVAQSWVVSPDGKTFTFTLRPGQKFHDGSPLTAEDAAFSLQRVVILNKTPAFLITQLGWTPENVGTLIQAVDAHTLRFTTPVRFAPSLVLNLMSSVVGSVVEKKLAMAHQAGGDLGNAWLKSHDAASGPFVLISWKPKESVTMQANPAYRLGPPGVGRIVIRNIVESASQRLLLEKGDVDIARNLTPDQIAAVAKRKGIRIEEFPGSDTWYVGLNQKDPRLANPLVRQAMRYLIDAQGMTGSFLKGSFKVHETFLPDGFLGALDDDPNHLDVAKAKALLAQAGFPNGFELRLDTPNTTPYTDIAQSVQQTMGLAGIKVAIVPADLKQVLTLYRARQHQMVLVNWGPDYLDPHTNADTFAYNPDNSDKAAEKPLAWRNDWAIPQLSQETLAAAQEPDTAKRVAMYHDLQKKVLEEGPFLILFQPTFQIAEQARVHGFIAGITSDLTYYRKVTK